jgi:hypothetical protein
MQPQNKQVWEEGRGEERRNRREGVGGRREGGKPRGGVKAGALVFCSSTLEAPGMHFRCTSPTIYSSDSCILCLIYVVRCTALVLCSAPGRVVRCAGGGAGRVSRCEASRAGLPFSESMSRWSTRLNGFLWAPFAHLPSRPASLSQTPACLPQPPLTGNRAHVLLPVFKLRLCFGIIKLVPKNLHASVVTVVTVACCSASVE